MKSIALETCPYSTTRTANVCPVLRVLIVQNTRLLRVSINEKTKTLFEKYFKINKTNHYL